MAKFTPEQATAYVAIQQLIHDWATELDIDNGAGIEHLITPDIRYTLGPNVFEGIEAVKGFYASRNARLSATPEGLPIHRHALSNLRVAFLSDTHAKITFGLIYFSTLGQATGQDHADPAAFADVRMEVRADADGDWRISFFDSGQTFRRVAKA